MVKIYIHTLYLVAVLFDCPNCSWCYCCYCCCNTCVLFVVIIIILFFSSSSSYESTNGANDLSSRKGRGSTNNNGTSFIKEGNRSIKNDKILTWQRTVLMSMSSIKPSSRNNCDPLSISNLTTSSNSNQSASSNQFGRCRATRKRGKYRLCLIFKYPSVHRRNGTATSRQPKNDHL